MSKLILIVLIISVLNTFEFWGYYLTIVVVKKGVNAYV